MKFSYDSPEAFEEVFWRIFWPEKYTDDSILLWDTGDFKEEAHIFFGEHMKKILALRRPDRPEDGRYISKNNGNIGRLGLIRKMFPDAKILVPIRHPLEHAGSLLRQNRNFIEMQNNEPFVRKYMADLGHYEFGDLHRPVNFSEVENLLFGRDPLEIDYWLAYWIATFQHIFEQRVNIILISYEATCADGKRAITNLCEKLEISPEGMLDDACSILKAPPPPRIDKMKCDPKLFCRAEELYEALSALT
jgi:hypothetical protein